MRLTGGNKDCTLHPGNISHHGCYMWIKEEIYHLTSITLTSVSRTTAAEGVTIVCSCFRIVCMRKNIEAGCQSYLILNVLLFLRKHMHKI